jgi:glycosyltransferase involved in cell wall biosynthesis
MSVAGTGGRRPKSPPGNRADAPRRTVAFLPAGDRFEDFHDKIGVSLRSFLNELTGGWFFNYVEALLLAGVEPVICFASAKVAAPSRFVHAPTGAPVWILPTPRTHRLIRRVRERFRPRSMALTALEAYTATPLRALARVLRGEGCQAILCQEYESERFDVLVLLGALVRLPVFATYQGVDRTATPVELPLRRLTVRRAAGLVIAAATEAHRARSTYGLPAVSIASIPNPVDVTSYVPLDRDQARASVGIAADARVAEWHGHMQVERKGLDVLVDAWDRVCAERPGERLLLLLVGSGRNTAPLRTRVASNPRVRWIDRYVLDRAELSRYLGAADVYVLSSRHEGFAVAPLEAMAAARPVVATAVSGVADLFPDPEATGAIVVPPEDAAALAAAIGALLDDPERARELGARGRRRAEDIYAIERVGPTLRAFLFGERPDGSD